MLTISDHMIIPLTAIRQGDSIGLSEASKQRLKELYCYFVNYGQKTVRVEILLQNPEDPAALPDDPYSTVLDRFLECKETLNIAAEQMLQDELLEAYAPLLREHYVSKYGVENCFFCNSDGSQICYWKPFLWIDIIEELLKELLFNRINTYGNSKEFTAIDGFIRTRDGKTIWSFISFIPISQDDNEHKNMNMAFGCGDILDIPLNSLAFHVFPDFFYYIALLKQGRFNISFDEVNKYEGAFILNKYSFGYH